MSVNKRADIGVPRSEGKFLGHTIEAFRTRHAGRRPPGHHLRRWEQFLCSWRSGRKSSGRRQGAPLSFCTLFAERKLMVAVGFYPTNGGSESCVTFEMLACS